MKTIGALVLALGLFVGAVLPANASPKPGVTGGAFIRSTDKTKTTLAISAEDNGLIGDSGQAQLVEHKPGSRAIPVHITITCVTVVDEVATAAGTGSDGQSYLIVIKDNGEGGSSQDEFGVTRNGGALALCLGSLIPSSHGTMGTADGGNFQVRS